MQYAAGRSWAIVKDMAEWPPTATWHRHLDPVHAVAEILKRSRRLRVQHRKTRQPQPESNFVSEVNNSWPQPAQT